MKDYVDKIVYVGIDIHKKTYAITCICEGAVVKRDALAASPQRFVEYVKKYFPHAKLKTVYETGFSGFVLHRYLIAQGIENIVVHAASVEISARDRVKTDKRDSLKLATQLSTGRLKGIHVPTSQREAYREISRLREKITRDKRRVGNRIKSLLYRQGLLSFENTGKVTKRWLEKISSYSCDGSIKYCIETCTKEWLFLEKQLKEIDDKLAQQAVLDKTLQEIYLSAPGVGIVHARVLANELEDMKHFHNEKQLFSFTGLTPTEYSSGEHKRQGHISRQGRSVLRKTLIQAAWKAIRKDASLQIIFTRISQKAGKKRAIVGIARRLIGQIRSCLKSDSHYKLREVSLIKNTP
jgi:transposase